MKPEETRTLIDHLDENRTGEPSAKLESLIADDPEAAQEWYYLNLAADAVRNTGLHEQVAAIRESLAAEQEPEDKTTVTDQYIAVPANQAHASQQPARPTIVRSIGRYSVRAAAIIIVVVSSTIIYKFVTVSSTSLYGRYFAAYELNTSRGEEAETPIVHAYNAGDWKGVIALAGKTASRDNQTEFLAGMADLQLGQCDEAITHFEQIIAANAQASTDYYQDEAEYYLAISWLACQKVNQAMPILEKIKADPNHKYHQKVDKMSFFDLRLAQYKENK